jgi:hypothetical protein
MQVASQWKAVENRVEMAQKWWSFLPGASSKPERNFSAAGDPDFSSGRKKDC